MKRFEEIPHTADWSFRAYGADLGELYANAGYALFALQGARPTPGVSEKERAVAVTAIDYESLMVNWLSELLWLQESHHEMYERYAIDYLTPTELRARAYGLTLATIDKVIKAVTFHNIKIEQTPADWQATVVVDV
jgi:SHS2 domain-containing protein